MIPLRLSLHNFMCYRDSAPALELEGIRLACLCGRNGHGKSALLDAITWALWGHARGKSQDELVHFGQKDMEVELEFLARGHRYKALRKHTKGSRTRPGATTLVLLTSSQNGFHDVSGNSVRQTEAKIRDLLSMDYLTFTQSAFLLQGRADAFTTQPPAERKRVLGEILSLSFYDRLEEKAKALAKDAEAQRQALEGALSEVERELARQEEHQHQLEEAQKALHSLQQELDRSRQEVEQQRKLVDTLRLLQEHLQESQASLRQSVEEMAFFQEEAQQRRARIREWEEILRQKPQLEQSHTCLLELRQENEALSITRERASQLQQKQAQLEKEIGLWEERLHSQHRDLQREKERLQSLVSNLPQWQQEKAQSHHQLQKLQEEERGLDEKLDKAAFLQQEAEHLRRINTQLKEEMQALRVKVDLLAQGDARCPLCNQELKDEGSQHLRTHYQEQGLEKKQRYRENEAQVQSGERESQGLRHEAASLKESLARARLELQTRLANLERDCQEAVAAQQRLPPLQEELQALETILQKGTPHHRELEEVRERLKALAYLPERHERVRQELKEMEPQEEQWRQLHEAEGRLPQEQKALEHAQRMAQQREISVKQTQEKLVADQERLTALPQEERALEEADLKHNRLLDQESRAKGRISAAQEQLNALAQLAQRREDKLRDLAQTSREKSLLDELATAFGKNGVQALLVEDALPELESEANKLLGLLTDHRMSIKLETQREGKKGTQETLEIVASDELGPRSYEMFSGGEAFRIDFALRIALSRLLAHRAGAPLPTLFIDEGFGTQDIQGQERLIEAINAIQNEFQTIIVITHIQEMKEAFPVRIEVIKTPQGSTFQIID